MDWDKISAELTRKLDPSHVKPAKQFGPKGDYIEGWHAMAEANRIFGFAASAIPLASPCMTRAGKTWALTRPRHHPAKSRQPRIKWLA